MESTVRLGSTGVTVKRLQWLLGINADGSFGPATLAAVKDFQRKCGLSQDGVVGEKTWKALMEKSDAVVTGAEYVPIDVHITPKDRKDADIKYLVIHYTAGSSSMYGRARAERETFVAKSASADFVVDDKEVVQINPNPRKYYCWAVGDGNGKYGITNGNSISIEMCSTLRYGTSPKYPNHAGWSLTQAVQDRTVALAKALMKKYGIRPEHVVRHYDASHKSCPGLLGWNDGKIHEENGMATTRNNTSEKWVAFRKRITE